MPSVGETETVKRTRVTCDDCYFRRAALCALPGEPCPTFRPYRREGLLPPPQARLVARPEVLAVRSA